MFNIPGQLRRAAGINTIPGNHSFIFLDWRTTRGTGGGGSKGYLAALPFFWQRCHNIWDHFTSAFEQNPVSDADIFFYYEVEIVQCCLSNNHSADRNRFKDSQGSQDSGPTYIDLDIQQSGFNFFSRIFIGKCCSWIFTYNSEILIELMIIDFNYNTVSVIGPGMSACRLRLANLNNFLDC